MKKPLPVGIENFEKLITNNYYYVDKTMFIKELLQKKGDVNLFTRPRRFGKTLNLSMLRYFFEDMLNGQKNQDNRALFAGLNIQREQEICEKYQGKYPVINLSLKSAKQPTFEMAYHCLREMLAYEYKRHLEVIHDKIPQNEMEKYMRFVQEKAERTEVNTAIQYLASILKNVYQKKVVILIDEYDVPLENAYYRGFYDEMVTFIRSLFESALKTNDNLEFAVVTGCLRISKESIFTGLNNLKIISVLDKTYGEYFGFTQREVNEMLCYYQREHKREEVREWYDGYLFGKSEVYNPWSVINYMDNSVADEDEFPRPYWSNTSSNSVVRDLVVRSDEQTKKEIEDMIVGGTIEKEIHEEITYEDIYKSQDNLWNFLFFTGYLKVVSERFAGENVYLTLAIPNAEVRYIYKNTILAWFEEQVRQKDFTHFYQALFEQDIEVLEEEISENLMETISFFDYKESYYHGFMTGLLSNLAKYYVESNREQGLGRPDIVIRSPQHKGFAIIIELKVAKTFAEMKEKAEEALEQIIDMKYEETLRLDGYHTFRYYGIAFYKKVCRVVSR